MKLPIINNVNFGKTSIKNNNRQIYLYSKKSFYRYKVSLSNNLGYAGPPSSLWICAWAERSRQISVSFHVPLNLSEEIQSYGGS